MSFSSHHRSTSHDSTRARLVPRQTCLGRLALAFVCLVGIAAGAPSPVAPAGVRSAGSSESANEYRLKAAFLSNFVKYTQWPKTALPQGAPLYVVLVGPEPNLAKVEELLEAREVRGHRLRVRRSATVAFEGAAHMVFAAGLESEQEAVLRAHVDKRPLLLVADREEAARDGCPIAFYPNRGKVRFAVNKKALSSSGLKVSSELLKLAKIVGAFE